MHIPFCFQSFAVPIFRTQLEKHKNYANSSTIWGFLQGSASKLTSLSFDESLDKD